MSVEKELLESLITRSMALELTTEANLLTRANIECFCSKIRIWIEENHNGDYSKAWGAFQEGRRPL